MKSVRKLVENKFGEYDISYPVLDCIEQSVIEYVRLCTEGVLLGNDAYNEVNRVFFMYAATGKATEAIPSQLGF